MYKLAILHLHIILAILAIYIYLLCLSKKLVKFCKFHRSQKSVQEIFHYTVYSTLFFLIFNSVLTFKMCKI